MNFYVAADYNGQVWVHINKPNNKEGWVWHSPGISIQINAKHYPKLKWSNPFQIVQKNAPEIESLIQELKDKLKPPALQLPCTVREYNSWFETKMEYDKFAKLQKSKIRNAVKELWKTEREGIMCYD